MTEKNLFSRSGKIKRKLIDRTANHDDDRAIDIDTPRIEPEMLVETRIKEISQHESSSHAASTPKLACFLDTDLAPETCLSVTTRTSSTTPQYLSAGGNGKAWEKMIQYLRNEPYKPIILSGPCGSGKTFGVNCISTNVLGYTVYEVNASSVCTPDEMENKIRHVSSTKTLLGPRLILVDDIEGFDSIYVHRLVRILQQRNTGDGPIVITCIDIYDPKIKMLREIGLTKVQMFVPSIDAMKQAYKKSANKYPPCIVAKHAIESNGNFHQLSLRLKTYALSLCAKNAMSEGKEVHINSNPDEHTDLFSTTQGLLQRESSVETWMRTAEPHILIHIIHSNHPKLSEMTTDVVDTMSKTADILSLSQTLHQENHKLHMIGTHAREHLFTTSNPRLFLPKYNYPMKGRSCLLDIPSPLGGLKMSYET